MDTILYFNQTKSFPGNTEETAEERFGRLCKIRSAECRFSDYRVVKVGLTEWQTERIFGAEAPAQKGFEWPWRRRRRRREWQEEREELLSQIQRLWGPPCGTWCLCDLPVELFADWRFTDYREERWVERLMVYATHPHFVVLGNADCLPAVLPRYARKMKSLRLALCEEEITEELEELLEELLEEYGIAAAVTRLEERADYRKLQALCPFPCNVMDFSGEERIFPSAVLQGSVWLDFSSDDEKRRRMERQGGKVRYVSLKKEWKQAVRGPGAG